MDNKQNFKKVLRMKDGVTITITSTHGMSSGEIKDYLKTSLLHEDLKDPVIKELYGYRSDRVGIIEHYKLESRGSRYIMIGDSTPNISVNKDIINEYLSNKSAHPLTISSDFGLNIEAMFGFTEEEVRQRVMKYYLP